MMKGNGKHHLTPEGLENLKRELNKLKTEDRSVLLKAYRKHEHKEI